MRDIIVIGNGFDLHCDLPSSFSKYFNEKRKNDELIDVSNIWFILLDECFYSRNMFYFEWYEFGEIDWIDIETFIELIVAKESSYFIKANNQGKNYIEFLSTVSKHADDEEYWKDDLFIKRLKKFFKENKGNIIDILYSQLNLLKRDFSKYLESKRNFDYLTKADAFFPKIAGNLNERPYVITFNYTYFFDSKILGAFNLEVNHIHGTLLGEDNIVIGFDSSKYGKIKGYKMSKAWQRNLINYEYPPMPSKDEVGKIIFYGHSLGEQDYSYFHALFDMYDLLNSNVKLFFYYSDYDGNDHFVEQSERVTNDSVSLR